jgi:hypothetical protein
VLRCTTVYCRAVGFAIRSYYCSVEIAGPSIKNIYCPGAAKYLTLERL